MVFYHFILDIFKQSLNMKSVALHNRLTSVILRTFTFLLFLAFSVSSYSQDIDEARQKEGKNLFYSWTVRFRKIYTIKHSIID